MKRQILKLLTREPLVPLFRPFQRGAATIFMLHRFADPQYGNDGHSVQNLRANLAFLRRNRFRLIRLSQLLDELDGDGFAATPAVAFTVDDGYGDFLRVAAPVFAEFDCPVTVFLTTAFVDGGFWMWWDKILWAFRETTRTSIDMQVDKRHCRYGLEDAAARSRGAADLIEKLKRVAEPVMQSAVEELLRVAEVELPREVPDMCLPMTWDDVRQCARQGVTFGPHTVTHPILSQVDDHRALAELEGSWQRLRDATSAAIPVFCFPNGDYASFTDRERQNAQAMGMRACVLAQQDFVTSRCALPDASSSITELPRFAYTGDSAQFRQIIGGVGRVKKMLGSALNGGMPTTTDFVTSSAVRGLTQA